MKKQSDKWAVEFYPNDQKDGPFRQVKFRTWREAATFASAILHSETTTTIMIVALNEQ